MCLPVQIVAHPRHCITLVTLAALACYLLYLDPRGGSIPEHVTIWVAVVPVIVCSFPSHIPQKGDELVFMSENQPALDSGCTKSEHMLDSRIALFPFDN